jgi:dephospho-CoA kinase
MRRFVVGLTGGIGSGKSAVSARFEALGITIADADIAARHVVEPGTIALTEIVAHFGPDILQTDGYLNRARLRAIVFEEPGQRRWLESVTVPAIMTRLKTVLAHSRSAYAILMLSSGSGQHPVMARDNNTQAQIDAMMASQPSREARLAYAQDIVTNEGSLTALDDQVSALHQKYTQLSSAIYGTT